MSECNHRSLTSKPGTWPEPVWCCSDCGEAQPYPGGCSHRRIDNETWQCKECGERMVSCERETETVLSVPNINPCRNPEHLAAMEAGEDFTCDHPYIPGPARVVPIAVRSNYQCERCHHDGTVFTSGEQTIWDCGHSHQGDRIRIRAAAGLGG